ncbi:MAG TPA: hypothetical protein VNR63_08075 [Gaiellaceae bacterium]|jgi:hypothetical protein|nr:hypothetical protein [Gaiellaceae bacterium]
MKVLLVLFAAAAILVGVELGKGAAHAGELHLADPCKPQTFKGSVVQRVVLDGLDGAACKLHMSREELVLSIGSNSPLHSRWDKKTIEVALRAGMLRAVDEAERRGEIPSLLADPIKKLIRTAPIDKLISGGISLGDLFSP